MPKVAMFFLVLLFSPMITNSHAFLPVDLDHDVKTITSFDSDIIDVDSDFFSENNFKRYLIFGTDSQKNNVLKTNSIYNIQSDYGFFSVSILSESSVSNLISQGYYVVEDFKLDYHSSDNEIKDASRIGDITGSDLAMKKYNSSGNGTIIAIC